LIDRSEIDFVNNRAFRFGDGLIETIRMSRGELLFFHDHIERMQAGMQALMMKPPSHWDARFFYECISRVLTANNFDNSARIRIQLWRTGEGLYAPGHATKALIFLLKLKKP
jgi:branched-subunit amino acid aminotransferase/4-amino-4-deoxychorismate lyase